LVLSLLHYSTTPSLQQTTAKGKEYGSPFREQSKAGYLGSGLFTTVTHERWILIFSAHSIKYVDILSTPNLCNPCPPPLFNVVEKRKF
jgi:hypothetical protein